MTEAEKRERIYEEYQEKVRRYISSRIQNPHDAEDLVSCVFLKVYQKLGDFDETRASLSTWWAALPTAPPAVCLAPMSA